MAARDAFLAVVAHELRNPMTPILSQVQRLRRQHEQSVLDPEQIGPALTALEGHIMRFVRRATSLLEVSRAREGPFVVHPRPVDLAKTIRNIVDQCRPAADHARCTLTATLPDRMEGWADPLAVEQIVENLVTNAVKYGRGSPIGVSVTESDGWTLVVEDGGPGIAPEDRERIFAKFERLIEAPSSAGGFGIGLWLVQQLTVAMGGTVAIGDSALGGVSVKIRAPWAPPAGV